MAERWHDEAWAKDMWWSGKTTRRRFLALTSATAGALGATMLVPAPWRDAFGQAKPYKVGVLQPLSGTARGRRQDRAGRRPDGGRPDQQVRRHQRPADRAGGRRLRVQARRRAPQGREDGARGQGRRARGRLPLERVPGLHAGLRGAQDRQHDRACAWTRRSPRPSAAATSSGRSTSRRRRPSRPRPTWSTRWARSGTSRYADYAWGQSTRDAFVEQIKKNGGEVVGTTGIPLGTADMAPFVSKISGNFDGLFGIFFGPQGVDFVDASYDLGLTKKYKSPATAPSRCRRHLPALGQQGRGVRRHRPLRPGAGRRR